MADEQNLKIQQQINEAIRLRGGLLTAQTRQLKEQLDIATELKEAMMATGLPDDSLDNVEKLTQSLKRLGDETRNQRDLAQEMAEELVEGTKQGETGVSEWIKSSKKAVKQTSVWALAAGGFTDGLVMSFKSITGGLMGIASLAVSAVGGIFNITKAILSIPFKMFNALIDEANRGGGGTEWMQAYEDVRKEFGNFKEDVAKNVIGAARTMRGELAKTGLSVFRTAGMMFERLNLVRELVVEMGPDFHVFGTEIMQNAEAMIAFQKGLGLSGESMKGLASFTVVSGKTMTQTLLDVTKFSTSFGKQFGISSKLISRDIGEMQQDMKVFGNLGVKTMTQLSVYSRKLGISFKELQGIVDKFDNFEDAAENAAKLSQAFGVNVDVMKMMAEQDPGKRVDMMRQAFFRSGKQIEKMTRQERAYLATTTGVEESALNQVFAIKNQGIAYGDMEKAGSSVEKQQMTQVEAMKKLSGAIERIVRSGNRVGGFFDRFVKGIRFGIRWSKDFRQSMWNIRKSLWAAEKAGWQVGRAFTKSFPGMEKIIKGFKEFFHPTKFRKLAGGVVKTFKQFFKDLSDPSKSVKALDNMLANFQKFFGRMIKDENSALGKIISGFKKAFAGIGQIALSLSKIVIENMAKAFGGIVDWLNSNMSFSEALKDTFKEGESIVGDTLTSMWNAISEQLGPASAQLWKSMKKLFDIVWGKVTKWWDGVDLVGMIVKMVKKHPGSSKALAFAILGPAFLKAGVSGMTGAIVKWMLEGGKSTAVQSAAGGLGNTLGSTLGTDTASSMFPTFKKAMSGAKGLFAGVFAKIAGVAGLSMGGIMAAGIAMKIVAGGALILAGLVGWGIGKWIDDTFDISGRIAKSMSDFTGRTAADIQRANDLIAHQSQGLQHLVGKQIESVDNAKLKFALTSKDKTATEQLRAVLTDNVNLTIKEKEIGLEILRNKEQLAKAEISRQIAEQKGYELARGGHLANKEDAAELSKLVDARMKKEGFNLENTMKQLKDLKKLKGESPSVVSAGQQAAQADRANKAVAGLKGKMDLGSDDAGPDIELFNKVKKLKSKHVQKVVDNFNNVIKPMLIGKGGLRESMAEIGKAFSDQEIGQALLVVNTLKEFGGITQGLGILAKAGKIDLASAVDGILNMRDVVEILGGEEVMAAITNLNTNSGGFKLAESNISVINDLVNNLHGTLTTLGKLKVPRKGEMKAAKVIHQMVNSVRILSNELSGINSVNLAPKLVNLGKTLGLGGSDSFTINNKNFRIDVNMTVVMETDTVAEVLLETGKFVKSPSNAK